MSDIDLEIQDSTGRVVNLTVSTDLTLEAVSILARDNLELPIKDIYGRTLTYALFHRKWGRFLSLDLTLYGHHIEPNNRLRILPRPFYHLFELELQSDPNPGMLFPISPKETTIGRDFSNEIVIRHKSVSRQHGIFEWHDGFHLYMDLGSANGSWINNQPVTEPTPIADGDILTLGKKVHLVYRERMTGLDPNAEEADEVLGDMQIDESGTGLVQIPRAQIYVSYSPSEQHLVEVVADELAKVGITILVDVDDTTAAMQIADVMVIILSRIAVKSEELLDEWAYYRSLHKPVIPVLFEPCRIPPMLEGLPHFVEYHHNDKILSREILETLHQVLASS